MEKIRIGIAGFGKMGSHHADALKGSPLFSLEAVFDVTPARREVAAKEYGLRAYDDLERFLRHPGLELVVVATPSNSHAEIAVRAMRAGANVVVEKPMALTVAEADEMLRAAKETGRMLSVYQNRRWDGDFLAARAAVEGGRIGKPQMLKVVWWTYLSALTGWSVPEFRPGWRTEKRFGGGLLYDWGAHYLDQALLLVPEKVVEVYGCLAGLKWCAEVDDTFLAVLKFAGGAVAQVEVSFASRAPFKTNGWAVSCEKGGYRDGTLYLEEEGKLREEKVEIPPRCPEKFYENIHAALRQGAPLVVRPEDVRRVIAVIEALFASHERGEAVKVSI